MVNINYILYLKKDIKYITFITLFSMVFQSTNVISINNLSLGPQIITNIIFIIIYLFKYHSNIIRKPSILEIIMYLIFTALFSYNIIYIIYYSKYIFSINYIYNYIYAW